MENNAQIVYDGIFALFILLIFLTGLFFIPFGDIYGDSDSNVALERLELLSSLDFGDTSILLALGNDSAAEDVVMDVLADESFVLRDLTLDRVLVERNSGGHGAVTARKTVGGHEFELTVFV